MRNIKQLTWLALCWLAVFSLAILVLPDFGSGDDTTKKKPSFISSKTENKAESSANVGSEESKPSGTTNIGSVSGTIQFSGTTPELKALVQKGAKVRDAVVCSAEAIPDQSLLVDSESLGIANVFVFLARAPRDGKTVAPKKPVVLDQKGCQFHPHCLNVQLGQELKVINNDGAIHNVHTFSIRNANCNSLTRPKDTTGMRIPLRRPETLPFRIKCDIHPWMSAYVLVLDHPFMAITDADGTFEIKDLPIGTHKLKIWHEKAGYLEKEYEVVVEKGKATRMNLEFGKDNFNVATKAGLKTITISSLP